MYSLKSSCEIVAPILTAFVNTSFSCGKFPDCLKVAMILPIHTQSDANDQVDNYWPISILPVISKVFEKIMHKRFFISKLFNFRLNPNLGSEARYLQLMSSLRF